MIATISSFFQNIDNDTVISPEVNSTMNDFGGKLEEIKITIDGLSSNFVEDYFDGINQQIADIGATLKREKDNIVNIVGDVNIFQNASGTIADVDQLLTDFYGYFYISLIVIGSLLVILLALLLVGLVLGCFGSPGTSLAAKASTVLKGQGYEIFTPFLRLWP